MKKFLKRLLFVVVILGIFSGLGWYSYKSGWLEKKLSTTSVPFEFFRTDNNKSINEMTVKNEGNRSAEALKKELSGLTSLFNSDTVTKPDVSSAPLTDSRKEELSKILEPIYGVENQFVGESHVTGFVQDKDGWNPIVTFSVFNDTSSIQNISYKFVKSDGGWSLSDKISETTDEFAYSELPDDFSVTYLDQIISQDDKFYKNKQWQNLTSTVPEEVTDLLSKNYPNTTSRVVYFDSTTIVKIYHAVSTPEKVKYIVRTQSLDSANSSVYSLNIE
jgi:hypothetical protein